MDRGSGTSSDSGSGAGPHMFYLEGKTLEEALAECKTAKERLRLLPQFAALCDAVGAAHSRGIIHRGLHPGTVLVSDYGETVVSDWSLSKVRGRPDRQRERFGDAATDAAVRPYLAPEILQGSVDEADARSDVYSLGAILHQLLTGKAPQAGAAAPDRADPIDPDVPRELAQICRRAMFQEASARYANASQLAESMRPFAASAAVAVVAVDHPEHGVDPLYKTLLGAAVLCLIVLAVGFGFSYRRLSAGRAEAVEARGKEIEARRSAEEARNKLAAQLKEADIARARIESDLDRSEGALAQVRAEFELVRAELQGAKEQSVAMHSAGEQANAITVIEERKPEAQPAKPAPEPKEAIKAEATPKAEQQLRDEKPVEPFSTPLPDLELATEEPGEAATPEEPAPTAPQESAPATPAPKPAGIDRPDFAKAMPDLIASVIAVEGAESQAAIRITDATPPAVKAMGLRDGDIITRINRNPIVTVDDAKQALVNVQKDTGFSIRVTRNGRTGWMRVNFTRPPEPPAVQPPQPEPAPAEPTPPPPAEPEPPADEAQPAPPEPEPENQ